MADLTPLFRRPGEEWGGYPAPHYDEYDTCGCPDHRAMRHARGMSQTAEAAVAHRPSCLGDPACQVCGEDCVAIRWTEVRAYASVIHRADLAAAVAAPGQQGGGRPLPARLEELAGSPWLHGDLAGLLSRLADTATCETDSAEVSDIRPAGTAAGSST